MLNTAGFRSPEILARFLRSYETYIRSSVDQTISYEHGGNDSSALFIDDVFAGGAGNMQTVSGSLELTANVPVKLLLVGYDAIPGHNVWMKPVAANSLESISGIELSAVPFSTHPTIEDVVLSEDAPEQTLYLAGISAGGGESQPLRVTATSNGLSLIPDPTITYTSPNATGTLTFTPVSDQSGTATITVTVEDGGLDTNLETAGDNATVSLAFDVIVELTNNPPSNVTLTDVVNTIPETTDTSSAIRIAGVDVTDDEHGSNVVNLSGPDASSFYYTAGFGGAFGGGFAQGGIYLNPGIALDAISKPSFQFTVEVSDTSLPGSDPATVGHTLTVLAEPTVAVTTPPVLPATSVVGDIIEFTATFPQAVTVDSTGGTPSIAINVGGSTEQAIYTSGSGSTDLVFQYEVKVNDEDANGITIPGLAIDLNGGSISAATGDVLLTFDAPTDTHWRVLVDAVAPVATLITPPADGSYFTASDLTFVVTFDSDVEVTGTPALPLTIGSTTRNASYVGGNGTNTLTFRCTIQSADQDVDGITVDPASITGTITDAAGNAADFSSVPAPSTAAVIVNPVIINSVTPSANGDYKEGDTIELTANFTEAVSVTGTPRIELTLDSGTVFADYASGSGATDIVFNYTVQSGDEDTNGITLTSPIDLNGGTISDVTGDALLTFTAPDTSAVNVDGVTPTVVSATGPTAGSYSDTANSNLDITVVMSEAVTVTGTPFIPLTIGGQVRDADYDAVLSSGNTLVFRYEITSPTDVFANDTLTVGAIDLAGGTITVQDAAGNDADLTAYVAPTPSGVLINRTEPTVTVTDGDSDISVVGEIIEFTAAFPHDVTVTGTPQIAINVGGTAQQADYVSGSGSTDLVFQYEVETDDEDTNGITITAPEISLNGGTMTDVNGDVVLSFSMPSTAGVLVDAVAPTVVGAPTGPVPGSYSDTANSNLDITVVMSEAVTVDETGGTPTIPLTIGGQVRNADYVSGSGTSTLVFRYTITSPTDVYADGTFTVGDINLAGGIIRDTAGNNADLTGYTAPTLSGVSINPTEITLEILNQGFDGGGSSYTLPVPPIDSDQGVQNTPERNFFRLIDQFGAPSWNAPQGRLQAAQILFNDTLDISSASSVELSFDFRITQVVRSADGILLAFVPKGDSFVGNLVHGEGQADSLRFMFDVYDNSVHASEPNANHVEINFDGNTENTDGWLASPMPTTQFDDGKWHAVDIHISQTPTGAKLNLYIQTDGNSETVVEDFLIPGFDFETEYYLAVHSGSGAEYAIHDIDNVVITKTNALSLNSTPTGSVTITGTPREDEVLTASNTLADADGLGAISYQWKRDAVAINGATNSTYTLVQADVGAVITVTASYTDHGGTNESVTSAATAAVVNVNDLPNGSVAITGTAREDEVLTASNTLADADGLGPISYQWKRDAVAISGATNSTYTLVQADVGSVISVTASYTDQGGTNESVTSAPTTVVLNVNDLPTGSVTITGTAREDEVLTASNTLTDADGLGAIGYQWKRDAVAISGATNSTYTLVQADVGAAITVTASYTDQGGTNESVTSPATAEVLNVNDIPTLDELTDVSMNEDDSQQTQGLSGITAGDSEVQALSVTAASDNPGLIPDPTVTYTSPDTTGSIAFTPVADQSGTATLTITVTDGGLDNDLATSEDNGATTRTIVVNVAPINDLPTIEVNGAFSIRENAPLRTLDLTAISAGGDESQPLRVTAVNDNTDLIPDLAVNYSTPDTTGSLTFTPTANQHGTATITVTIEDGGFDNDLETSSDNEIFSRAISIVVAEINEAPALDPTALPAFDNVIEDAGAPSGPVGTLVDTLVDTGGTHDNFSDSNGDLPGIAITGANLQGGKLWYSTDNGSTWV